jgi:hypothetical protein
LTTFCADADTTAFFNANPIEQATNVEVVSGTAQYLTSQFLAALPLIRATPQQLLLIRPLAISF